MDMPTPSEVAAVLQELDVPKPLRGQFFMGFQVEWEHAHTVDYDLLTVGKIVLDHLEEDPKYYTKLRKIHKEARKNPMRQPEDREGFRFAVIEHEKPDGAFKGRIILAAYDTEGQMLAWIGALPARTKPYNDLLGLHEWNMEPQDKAWEVGQSHAWEDGWGPLMYEALVVFLAQKGYSGWLLNDPNCTSREARAVWKKFSEREDVDFIELPTEKDHPPRFAIRARPELLARREKLVKKPDTDRIRKRLVKLFLRDADESGIYDDTAIVPRKNPFIPKTQFYGKSARYKEQEGGFHVADEESYAIPYAQQKWETSPFRSFGSRLKFGAVEFPVILKLDVTGIPMLADIDARRAAVVISQTYGHDYEYFESNAEALSEESNTPNIAVGDNALNTLFSEFSITSPPVGIQRLYSMNLGQGAYEKIVAIGERLRFDDDLPLSDNEEALLVEAFGQARIMVPVSDARLLEVRYMSPYFPTVVEESQFEEPDDEDEYEYRARNEAVLKALEEGYNFVEVDNPNQNPYTQLAWRRTSEEVPMGFEVPKAKKVMYHGTSLSNLLRAAPWLASKLAPPPRPQKGGIRGLVRAMKKEK